MRCTMRKKSIRTYYIKVIVTLSAILLLFLGAAYFYSTSVFNERSKQLVAQTEKADVIGDISESISGLFFRSRGFYSFKLESELELAYEEITNIQKANERLSKMPLNEKEKQFSNEISGFITNYENNLLPKAVRLVEADDYQGLRQLSSDGANLSVNQFVKYAEQYKEQASMARDEYYQKSEQRLNQLYLAILIVGLCASLALILLSWRVVKRLIAPIESMTQATGHYLSNQVVNYVPEQRADEIGSLSNSFATMMGTIQTTEQALLAQNDELLSQQDELFFRQKQLEEALSEARYAKIRLERYNGLSHQISFSDDIEGIANATLQYLETLYVIEQGIVYVPSNDLHVLHGISQQDFITLSAEDFELLFIRLQKEPCFQVQRVLEDGSVAYDFFVAPILPGQTFKALFVLTRINREFTAEDQLDLFGLANRISLAIDRIEQLETINRQRQLNQTILDNLEEGIHFVSSETNDIQVNEALSTLLGQSTALLSQSNWVEEVVKLTTEGDTLRMFIEDTLDASTTGLSETVYSLANRPSHKVISLYGSPVYYDNKRIGTLFVHRDITQAFEIDLMKTELVSTVSHELRTPLSSILGFTELLINKDMDASRQSRYLDAIYKEAKRLTSLINDFLDVQRMESGNQEYSMHEVDVVKVAEQTIQNASIQDGTHEIQLKQLTNRTICIADEDRLIQVFTNLLNNAIKFSPDGGNVTITVATSHEYLRVTIEDEGIGIPADQLKHMFEKFYRFDNTYSRKIGGTGLGLAICRKIVEKHGGEIIVESEENVGTTVSFTLPLKTAQVEHNEHTGLPVIVVVEDDASIALLLEEELKNQYYEVIHLQSVAHSFSYAKEHVPDLMVIDLMLKEELTGWDLIGMLKEDEATRHIPIIISSALEREEVLTSKFAIEHYMTKPYSLWTFSETVAQTLKMEDGRILYPEQK